MDIGKYQPTDTVHYTSQEQIQAKITGRKHLISNVGQDVISHIMSMIEMAICFKTGLPQYSGDEIAEGVWGMVKHASELANSVPHMYRFYGTDLEWQKKFQGLTSVDLAKVVDGTGSELGQTISGFLKYISIFSTRHMQTHNVATLNLGTVRTCLQTIPGIDYEVELMDFL
jgi:hypothetical protein